MQKQRYHSDGSCQGRFANPRVAVQEHRGAPLLNCSGIVIIRQLIERLGIARAINCACCGATSRMPSRITSSR